MHTVGAEEFRVWQFTSIWQSGKCTATVCRAAFICIVHVQDDDANKKPDSNIIGQKSEKALVAATAKKGKKGRASAAAPANGDAKMRYSKSGSVFKRMQEQKEAAVAGIVAASSADADAPVPKRAASLKL